MAIQYEDLYKQGIRDLNEVMPRVVESYNTFTGICFEGGVLDKKQKELIALGISLSHRDENCVRYHVCEAKQKGATEQEIWETVNVAVAMSGGMTISQSVHWVREAFTASVSTQ